MANWRKTSTPNVYVAHQRRCAAFVDVGARCSCTPSWRGRRWNPFTHRSEWQKPVVRDRSEVLSWLGAGKKGGTHLRERASSGRTFESIGDEWIAGQDDPRQPYRHRLRHTRAAGLDSRQRPPSRALRRAGSAVGHELRDRRRGRPAVTAAVGSRASSCSTRRPVYASPSLAQAQHSTCALHCGARVVGGQGDRGAARRAAQSRRDRDRCGGAHRDARAALPAAKRRHAVGQSDPCCRRPRPRPIGPVILPRPPPTDGRSGDTSQGRSSALATAIAVSADGAPVPSPRRRIAGQERGSASGRRAARLDQRTYEVLVSLPDGPHAGCRVRDGAPKTRCW